MMTILKRAIIVGALCVLSTSAFAHSPLTATVPDNGVVIAAVPATVMLDFKGDIRLTRVTLAHAGSAAIDLDLAGLTDFTDHFDIPLTDLGAGVYVIEWRGLGSDGHALTGTLRFTVK